MQGNIVPRLNHIFYDIVDSVNQELCDIAGAFGEGNGRARLVDHPAIANEPEAVKGGGLFYIYKVEIAHDLRSDIRLASDFCMKYYST